MWASSSVHVAALLLIASSLLCSAMSFKPGFKMTKGYNNFAAPQTTQNAVLTHNKLRRAKTVRSLEMSSSGPCPPKIIIAGAPAAGKGTQCEFIKSEFGVVHLSTGDMLRAAVSEGTDLGVKAKAFMDAGQLVPDELIIDVVCDRLKQPDCLSNGWLLDGFPRTKSQAEALSAAGMIPDKFILLDVPEEVLVERVTGRRTDPVTGKIYHMKFNPPENDEVADRLVQRSDDTAEKIVVRYREFQANIDSVRSSYEEILVTVDGTKGQKDVSESIFTSLKKEELV